MRLEGSLDAFSLPDIFSLLSMTKKTGGLHLRRADAHGVVWLGDGLITGGSSDLSALALGHRIAGIGSVSDEALAAAVDAVQGDSATGIAAALREAGAIDDETVQAAVSEHIIDTVFDLMRWPDGVFQFATDATNADDVSVARPVDEVVGEARRRLEVWNEIDPALAAPGAVLALVLEPAKDLKLDSDEWSLLALVDGRRTVQDLVRLCGRGEFSVVVALAALADRGLIAVADDTSDGIGSLVRRQDLISALEAQGLGDSGSESVESAAEPVSDSTPEAVDETDEVEDDTDDEDDADDSDDADDESDEDVIEADVAEPRQIAPRLTLAEEVSAGEYDADIDFLTTADANREAAALTSVPAASLNDDSASIVTPARPEPFLPAREPDHPEPLAVAADGSVASPLPSSLIERDPSVNKSLLLRLIAGVRGL